MQDDSDFATICLRANAEEAESLLLLHALLTRFSSDLSSLATFKDLFGFLTHWCEMTEGALQFQDYGIPETAHTELRAAINHLQQAAEYSKKVMNAR